MEAVLYYWPQWKSVDVLGTHLLEEVTQRLLTKV